jgi:hypothetical protein
MQKNRRKKILLFLAFFLIAVAIAGYFFRYPLILAFQLSRIRSINCQPVQGNDNNSCLQRIWVHRVNSQQRYDVLENKFEGFETDIVFNNDSRGFSVYHPPLPPEGDTLSLNDFFNHVDLVKKHFWLDTRAVDSSNMNEALSALQLLDNRYRIRSSCIIELYDLSAAELFARNGYIVSFNVSEPLQQQLRLNDLLRDSIERVLAPVKYVSQDSRYVPAMKKFFPGKKIITWHLVFRDFFKTEPVRQLLNDPQIEIVLMNIKSRFFR